MILEVSQVVIVVLVFNLDFSESVGPLPLVVLVYGGGLWLRQCVGVTWTLLRGLLLASDDVVHAFDVHLREMRQQHVVTSELARTLQVLEMDLIEGGPRSHDAFTDALLANILNEHGFPLWA